MQQGLQLFIAAGHFPGKCHIKQANQEDLIKVDIWQLGMTFFCIVSVLYDFIHFSRHKNIKLFGVCL